MRALLLWIVLCGPVVAQAPYYQPYWGPVVAQQNVQRVYVRQPRYYQPLLYGYGYGPGFYSSANQPIILQTNVNDPFGYYGW